MLPLPGDPHPELPGGDDVRRMNGGMLRPAAIPGEYVPARDTSDLPQMTVGEALAQIARSFPPLDLDFPKDAA